MGNKQENKHFRLELGPGQDSELVKQMLRAGGASVKPLPNGDLDVEASQDTHDNAGRYGTVWDLDQ